MATVQNYDVISIPNDLFRYRADLKESVLNVLLN